MASVILDGCDGTGKTTLAKIIAAKYGWDICHCTGDDPKDYEFYRQTGKKQNVVWDRHTIGELIYPTVFNRKPELATAAVHRGNRRSGIQYQLRLYIIFINI